MIFDIAIIGAGMAGASLAAMIGARASVVLLEGESYPGYHTTGRSAAFWSETYGGPDIQPLTSASGPFLTAPPADFSEQGYLSPRGELEIATADEARMIDERLTQFSDTHVDLKRLGADRLHALVPELRPKWRDAALLASCQDIDVARLHQDYLRAARRSGVALRTDARLVSATRNHGHWRLVMQNGEAIEAKTLVNAGGAWADHIADIAGVARIGIEPKRRTMVQLRLAEPVRSDLPLIVAADGSFYFKPDTGGRLWLSPHDETPSPPCDAQAEEIDVAMAIDRLEKATHFTVDNVERSWAGLRSFAPDRLPVIGPDVKVPDFFWFAGQGGFGIQTAPAAAMIGAALLVGHDLPPEVAAIDADRYHPRRFA